MNVKTLLLFVITIFVFETHGANVSVVAAKGNVYVHASAQAESALKVGMSVADGSIVKTGPEALLILAYPDGTKLKFKDNTEVKIHISDEMMANHSETTVDLVAGALFAAVVHGDKRHFIVKTRTAIAGVRGTQFFASLGEHDAFWLCVEEGSVDVHPADSKDSLTVPKGLGVLVEQGKKPDSPKEYAWTKKLNWNMDPEKGDVVDHTTIEGEYKDLLKNHYD